MTRPTPKLYRLLSKIEHDGVRDVLRASRNGALTDGSIEVVAAYIVEQQDIAQDMHDRIGKVLEDAR